MASPPKGRTPKAKAATVKKGNGKRDAAVDPVYQLIYRLVVYDDLSWQQVASDLETNSLWGKHATVALVYGRFKRNAEECARLEQRENFNVQDYMYRDYMQDGQVRRRRTRAGVRSGGRLEEVIAEDEEDEFLMQEWERAEVEMHRAVAREMTRATGRNWSADDCTARYNFIAER